MAGLTPQGLVIKRLDEIQKDLSDAVLATFGPETQTGPDSVFGQLIGVFAIELSSIWELAAQLYDSFDPDAAEGAQLDNLAALVGVSRLAATKSTGEVTLGGTASTLVPAGSIVENSANGARFVIVSDATIGGADALVEGETTGPLTALAGSIDTIITPVAGWDSVTNALDITPGRDVETDAELRARRESSLQITGAAVDLAIRAKVREISGVEQALVISNRTSADPDTNGLPAHSFETVVYPDLSDPAHNLVIAETIFRVQPAGIQAFGSLSFSVTDDEEYVQQVAFTFATEITMYVRATITRGADYPADGDAQVAAALLAEGETLSVGDDVLVWRFLASLDPIPGITNVVIEVEDVNPPTNTANIAIDFRSVAAFDSSRITVV